mmetsp:Transcript_30624/g.65139  ORF Transcript_30624/g.65139 Transcript_30624/m.65139 type:complete len:280 (-) Transcript_30624:39-878(-)
MPAAVKRRPAGVGTTKRPVPAAEATSGRPAKLAKGAPSDTDEVVPDSSAAALQMASTLKDAGWKAALQEELSKPYFSEIADFVAAERSEHAVYPPEDLVFEAFNSTPFEDLKVVIIGQDPYHEPGQAHGLSFSVLPGIRPPPSLKNMYKELEQDIPGFRTPEHGHLVQWARQGVLMLNATLTVRGGHTEANSHSKCGWQQFTDAVMRALNAHDKGLVFLLWGGFAKKKGKIIDTSRHVVIESAHPSPLSVTKWRGCKTFSKCNDALRTLGREEIKWILD